MKALPAPTLTFTFSFLIVSLAHVGFIFFILFRYSSNKRLSRSAKPDQLYRETRYPW